MSIDADFSDYEDEASGDENVLPNTTTKRVCKCLWNLLLF